MKKKIRHTSHSRKAAPDTKDLDRLYFTSEISDDVGISGHGFWLLKRKGCPFYGQKTTIRWVRDFIAREAGAIPNCREEVAIYQFFDHFVELVRAKIESGRR